MSNYIAATDGTPLDVESLPHSFGYDTNGRLVTDSVLHPNNNTYVQTLTYNAAGQLTGTSQWVKQ